jgi:hypothetical protein
MSAFTANWLRLRELYDTRARNPIVLDAVVDAAAERLLTSIVDLACGAGATLRATSSRLPAGQQWRLVDNDLDLLRRANAITGTPRANVGTLCLDLAQGLQTALDGTIDIVTTSAFLDLVSEEWLEQLVWLTTSRQILVYAALSYDGRAELRPIEPYDATIVAAVNRHQLGDKGFGPALGPNAATTAIGRFQMAGYDVLRGKSDWMCGPDDQEIQLEIFARWADAARETGDVPIADIDSWLTARRAAVAAGLSFLRVGHIDFFARPIARH